jgi:hypothetical protein
MLAALLLAAAIAGSPEPSPHVDSVALDAGSKAHSSLSRRLLGPADTSSWRAALEGVVDSLVGEGHLLAAARLDSLVMLGDSLLVLHGDGATGPKFFWSTLEQRGSRLRPSTLARIARWKPGVEADPALLERALDRLEATSWVARSAPAVLRREPRSLRVGATLHLQDLPGSFLEAAGGWTSGEDASGQILAQLANLLGTARSLEFSVAQDGNGSRARAQWTEPWIGPVDLALKLGGQFQADSLVHGIRLWSDLEGAPGTGRLLLSAGIGWWRHSERSPGDTAFAPSTTETSTRLGARGSLGDLDGFWPRRRLESRLSTETVLQELDLGRLRVENLTEGTLPLWGPLGLHGRLGLRGIWPLDPSTPLGEMSSPGGVDGWHGWREGSPWSPSWAWSAFEARLGTTDRGGLRAFWEPGLWWVRRPDDQEWEARATWTAGGGVRWRAGAWEIDVLVAGDRQTPTWEDALVHLRARNRF